METKDIDISEITKKFHQFETQYIEGKDWGLWDATRFWLYYDIQNKIIQAPKGNNYITKLSHHYFRSLKSFLRLMTEANKSVDFLIFSASRFRDENGDWYDPNIIDINRQLQSRGKVLVLDSCNKANNKEYNSIFNSGIGLIYKILPSTHTSLSEKILNKLDEIFEVKVDRKIPLNEISRFNKEKKYYLWLFKKVHPKAIFLTQNGIQKGMMAAANQLSIPLIELQHGIIYFSHLAYSYGSDVNPDKLYLPDYFLTFSEFWKRKVNDCFPVKEIISCGNTKASSIKPSSKVYDLSFICTTSYIEPFLKILEDLRNLGYKGKVCLKLHPQQLPEYENLKSKFSEDNDTSVIYTEISMKDIIGMSKRMVAIQSTSVYEALDAGTEVLILKMLSYNTQNDVLNHPLVKLIENADDIISEVNNEIPVTISHEKYFEPYKPEKFETLLNRIL